MSSIARAMIFFVAMYITAIPAAGAQEGAVSAGTGPLPFAVEKIGPEPSPKAAQESTRILGDVNNDGQVTMADALIVATYDADDTVSIPNGGDISLGDVNKDGRVSISDALIIASYEIDPTNPALPPGIGKKVEPPAHTISGQVTESGAGLGNVAVTLSEDASLITNTDHDGRYIFRDLSAGSYTVTPEKVGYLFSPNAHNVALSGTDVTGQDFGGQTVPEAIEEVTTTQRESVSKMNEFLTNQDLSGAMTQTAQWLQSQPHIQTAQDVGKATINIQYKSGITGSIFIAQVDSNGKFLTMGGGQRLVQRLKLRNGEAKLLSTKPTRICSSKTFPKMDLGLFQTRTSWFALPLRTKLTIKVQALKKSSNL